MTYYESSRLACLQKFLFICFFVFFCNQPTKAQNQESKQQLNSLKRIKNIDSATAYANKLIAVARRKNDKLQEARILYLQSKLAYKTGNSDRALDYARRSLNLTDFSDPFTYTQSSTMIAYMLSNQGKDIEALNAAFKILHETDNRNWKAQNINCMACIADLYRAIGKIPEALKYALQASAGARSVKDTGLYIYTLSTLSNLYSDPNIKSPANRVIATKYLEIILAHPYLQLLSDFDRAKYLGNLGRLYVLQNSPKAEAILKRSIDISHQNNFTGLEKHALNELMSMCIDRSHYREAVNCGLQAIAIEPESQTNKVLQKNIFQHIADAYAGLGNYERALTYYQKQTELNDSIVAAQKARDALEIDKKYAADKRLLVAGTKTKLLQQQRNFTGTIALIIIIVLITVYRWLIYKKKKEATLLAQEHRQLAKLDALKTRFFANVSHELRTPLTLIMGPADQLLNKQIDGEQQQNHLLTISNNSKKLLNIVNELLDLGKLEAGKLEVKLKAVALVPFIKLLYQDFSSTAELKNINYKLICNIDAQLFAQLDRDKFEKISNNLIGNAIKFTPNGGTITIVAAIASKHIEFNVTNSGSGIHPKDLPYIFDRYYQGYQTELPLEGGTGIGLAITREFTELMDGNITIENKWGEGTTFKVSIPLISAEQRAIEKTSNPDYIKSPKQVSTGNKPLVMIVEDNAEMSNYIISILQPTHTLVTAYNGAEALRMLQTIANLPSLIISDAMMPEMDGFTLLETLKQSPAFCTVPVIMLTALTDIGHKLKALNIGVDDYITKPFLNNELISRVTNLISNAAARSKTSTLDTEELIESDNREVSHIQIEEDELLSSSPADLAWLSELEDLIRKSTGKTNLNLNMLSYTMAISERQLFRRIKSITGLTPNKYIRAIRLQIAREAIESGRHRTIAEVSYAAGFETPAYFSRLFKEHYGREVSELL
jgi:signal transduction histidine kinase/DNA-binding response OmpR family regulator